MSRQKLANAMIDYLEAKINCKNVEKFIQTTTVEEIGKGKESIVFKLGIEKDFLALKIMNYNGSENYIRKDKNDAKDRLWVENLFFTFDFMTESNYLGFEYFPYLYGVLDCENTSDVSNKIFIFYEIFDGDLGKLLENLEHPSEWYDIIFQMANINFYIEVVQGYRYNDGTVVNHLYKKITKPYYKEYNLEDVKFNINHKYLIVLWDFNYMEKITTKNKNMVTSNLTFLIRYIEKNKTKINIEPSPRIINLINDLIKNPESTIKILDMYYNVKA